MSASDNQSRDRDLYRAARLLDDFRRARSEQIALRLAVSAGLFLLLFLLSRYNYLLYHSAVELLTVSVGLTIFSIGWNSRKIVLNKLYLLLAVAYLAVAVLDGLHALAYQGMGVFPGTDADPATQLWISARYLEAASLFLAGIFASTRRSVRADVLISGYAVATAVLVVMIFPLRAFPSCYVAGRGLTTFKIISEYIVCGLLIAAACLFWKQRRLLDVRILRLLLAAIGTTVLAELTFTFYVDIYGFFNFLGHIFKLLSFVFIYWALVQGSLKTPHESLFRELARSESALRQELEGRRRLEAVAVEAERLRAFRDLARGVAHNFNNLLTGIMGHAAFVKQALQEGGQARRDIGSVLESAERAANLSRQLLLYSDPAPGVPEKISLQTLIDDLAAECRAFLPENVQLRISVLRPQVTIEGVVDRLKTALLHLCTNAREAMPEGGILSVTADIAPPSNDESDRSFAVIEIADTGVGIPADALTRVFDPFFSTKGSVGVGLSLAITKRVVQDHQGRIELASSSGKGTTVRVYLPTC